ncbi:unnamed protein product [Closterium sp. NIES-53]
MKKLPLVAKRSPPFPSPPPPPPSHRCHWDLAASAYPQFFQAFAAERKDGDEKVPSRFRRKKLPKSERRAVAGSGGAELAGASAHPVDFFDIRGEYSDFESISTDVLPLVLVDGYNVVGSWPKLKKPFLRGDTEEARERLLLEVLPYPRYADVRVLVVFDGYNSNSPGNDRILSFGVDVAFSNGISADEWIEKELGGAGRSCGEMGGAGNWGSGRERENRIGNGTLHQPPPHSLPSPWSLQEQG